MDGLPKEPQIYMKENMLPSYVSSASTLLCYTLLARVDNN